MAAITLASTVTDISAFLPGCPSLVIENTIRKIIIDLCQRARVWSVDLASFPTVSGTSGYILASPFVYAEIMDPESVYLAIDGTRKDLTGTTTTKVKQMYPNYPLDANGQPTGFFYTPGSTLTLVPTPDAAYTVNPRVFLRPTRVASSWDADLYAEFARAVFHGVLYEMMTMPNRSWTDGKLGVFHGKEWAFLLAEARDRALRGFSRADLCVDPIPFA